jgi:Brp/Blh family beta-carotene 15,15'-monooxygenase
MPLYTSRLMLAYIAVAAALCVTHAVWPLSLLTQLALFVGGVSSLGFLHGALDIQVMRKSGGLHAKLMKLLIAYGLISLALLLGFLLFPGIAFIALLVVSAWHFGELTDNAAPAVISPTAWVQLQSLWHRLVRGAAPVCLPVLLAGEQVQAGLRLIVGASSSSAAWVWSTWQVASWAWFALAAIASLVVLRNWFITRSFTANDKLTALEIILLSLCYMMLPTLMAFSAYFLAYHSSGHIWRVSDWLKRERAGWGAGPVMLIMLLTFTMGAIAAATLLSPDTHSPIDVNASQALYDHGLRWTIALLAALSFPHAALVSWWHAEQTKP